ncbi:MAG: ribosomal RNA small subunit methyltransferase A [Pseudobdellovibrionaceae bacterium]|nr:ribosomal RNA small subunit methyltransferase A [Bdellovibrionales bacterium]USN46430.1 MAG: ribosomal RNA small subunit methyltransferase A [Pseudobdellovibrionaceae bacterium]
MSQSAKIKARLAEMGVSPKRSLGQNFLVSEWAINKIISSAHQLGADEYIEVGPGLGSLTEGLMGFQKPLTLIELDREFSQYWREQGLKVIEEDALSFSWGQLPLHGPTALVSNLPYQISSSLVIKLSEGPPQLQHMVLMFQKEVAQRIMSPAKSKAYGLLSVIAQTYWQIEQLLDVGPKDFLPPPKVASRVLVFHRKPVEEIHYNQFLSFVKASFSQRRKFLLKNIKGFQGMVGDLRLQAEEFLLSRGLSPQVRAEALSPSDFVALYKHLFVG